MKINFVKVGDVMLPTKCLHYRSRRVTGALEPFFKTIYYPCGKCYACRKRIASQWAFRCNIESEDRYVYNMKFTYKDSKLPIHNGKPSLNRTQLSDAFKRLRYYLDKEHKVQVRFFANGEYSPEQKRPHYHAILFSPVPLETLDSRAKLSLEWMNGKFVKHERVSDGVLSSVWPFGIASINRYDSSRGQVGAMVGYMVNYMFTDISSDFDNFNKPFKIMSRGLGERLSERYPKIVRNCKNRGEYTFTLPHPYLDITVAYPRYYTNKWMNDDEKFKRKYAYHDMCKRYNDYLTNLNQEDYEQYKRNKEFLKIEERRDELSNYRKRKIHRDN